MNSQLTGSLLAVELLSLFKSKASGKHEVDFVIYRVLEKCPKGLGEGVGLRGLIGEGASKDLTESFI